jgi:hypothetical protein
MKKKGCAYCNKPLNPDAHRQSRASWCCDECFDRVSKEIEKMKNKEPKGL